MIRLWLLRARTAAAQIVQLEAELAQFDQPYYTDYRDRVRRSMVINRLEAERRYLTFNLQVGGLRLLAEATPPLSAVEVSLPARPVVETGMATVPAPSGSQGPERAPGTHMLWPAPPVLKRSPGWTPLC